MPTLHRDVIISDIVPNLERAEEYIRRVLGQMSACKKAHGTAEVRLGITGQGIAPHYRVEPTLDMDTFNGNFEDYFAPFHGRSHEKLDWGPFDLKTDHWSDKVMSYDEVSDLLGSVRKLNKRK